MEHDNNLKLPKQEKLPGQLWFTYAPFWPLFLLLLLFFLSGAWFYLQYTPPVYEASAAIIIKDNKRGVENSKMLDELNQFSVPTIVENEIEVFKSRALMEEVVKRLALYAPVFTDGKFRPIAAYGYSPIKVEAQNPDSIREVHRVDFIFDSATGKVSFNRHTYPVNQWVTTAYGVLRFTLQKSAAGAGAHFYFSLLNPKYVVSGLLGKLDVSSNKLSTVVSLKIPDEVPRRSEDILNELLSVYNTASINDKNILAANTLKFVEERLNYVTKDLDSIERGLQQYRSSRGVIDIGTQGKLFLENVSVNDQKLSDVNMKLAVLDKVEQYLSSKDSRGGLVPSTMGIEDPLLSELLTKLYEAEMQYAKLKQTTGENNLVATSLAGDIQRMKPSILENIRNQRQNFESSKRNLYATNNSYTALLQKIPQQERNLIEISREQNIKSSIYNYLLQKREEAALSHSAVADTRVIDKAQCSFLPIGPDKKMIYLLAVGLALFAGFAIVSLIKLLGRKILFRHEIEEVTTFPIIGEIGLHKRNEVLVIGGGKASFVAEQFRKLRASLSYFGIGIDKKKVLITSTVSGEGKSFITLNLGMTLALTGKKVVIVEFDLTSPSIATRLSNTVDKGITEYLTGDVDVQDIIKSVSENENLFFVSSGSSIEEPSDLIYHRKVKELFNYLEKKFDYILVDTPPIGALSDAYELSRYCDATLYVVRYKYTPRILLQHLDEYKIEELKNVALIFNGVRKRGFGLDRYSYYYGYGSAASKRVGAYAKN